MYFPLNYEKINLYNGTFTPSDKFSDSLAFNFWCRALYQRALSVFDFINLPTDFNREEISLMYYLLYADGFCGSMKVNSDLGVIVNPISPKGLNAFYGPSSFILTNAYIDDGFNKEYKVYKLGQEDKNVDEYGVILAMSPDYIGIGDIIIYYAEKLANMSAGLDMNIENSKFAYVIGANSKSGRNFLKKLIDKIRSGVSTIIFDSQITPPDDYQSFEFFNRDNLKSSYMVSEFNSDIQTLINQFDAEIGIINVPYEKKERMTQFEAESKQSDGIARACLWRDNLQRSFDEFNELFGYNVKVVYNYEYMLNTESDESDDTGGDINE
jgi:hypothetical protein